jgi:hypothetical protein
LQLIGPEKRRLDGAVLDIHLHGHAVHDFADAPTESHVPFLFSTALDREAIPEQFRCTPILSKPASPAATASEVEKLVRARPKRVDKLVVPSNLSNEPMEVHVARALARTLGRRSF